ncbi:hypothetical protein A3B93_01830 [Candidatus Nomurabacteria bacterium RIFCSPHIGHO2_02_FULL_42_24]|uniref:Uncharacterized protein n=1 Tax=Candidatus Nomurabacteria bacterium RIFCSPHIGHO2_02_FULL_42_24 TaxID=1801757 RepID=A0A1F6WIQ0_9BACT|nr:MAG: hypothetical protein UV08_C0016G0013 [Parcubacteria group bacterium GW2011_GWA2_42_18]OGI81666.1 MAG: hypothetical protein A3B93_01830 [Candidatus Nomurabacteria bacterium RIFCSPHIGHO2_02_FULL_42_24]
MKTALTIIITLAFLGIFTAGPLSMGHGAHNGCLAASVQEANCPENGLLFASFHISALKWFSTAFLNIGIAIILAILLLVIGFIFQLLPPVFSTPQFSVLKSFRPPRIKLGWRILHWLKFHENSPSFR